MTAVPRDRGESALFLVSPMLKTLLDRRRLRATAWHLAFSLALAGSVALLVFLVWYPGPYA